MPKNRNQDKQNKSPKHECNTLKSESSDGQDASKIKNSNQLCTKSALNYSCK